MSTIVAIGGGWAIDLAVNEVTRIHKDIDICIFREHVEYALSYFNDWDINVVIPGEHRLSTSIKWSANF